jgi:hypothetical protein
MEILKSLKKPVIVFIGLAATGFFVFSSILDNSFLSDDYDSLYRICIEKRVIVKEFLRPMIDISFYVNYLISGLDSRSYYIFNLIVHILNAFLLYKFSLKYIFFEQQRQEIFAIGTAVLFLIYPFHNEGIVWLTGRLSSMACFFALLSLNTWMSRMNQWAKVVLGILFYFTGLLAYESILLLPLIFAILEWGKARSVKSTLGKLAFCAMLTGVYLVLRYNISGTIYGGYGERMVEAGQEQHLVKVAKTFGRTFLPPYENSEALKVIFAAVMIFFILLHYQLIRRLASGRTFLLQYFKILLVFLAAMLIPVLFGISTRTSEGDRLLYFPSVFLCMIISSLILALLNKRIYQWAAFLLIGIYFLSFLSFNNKQWNKASDASVQIMSAVKNSNGRFVYFINLPDELDGAFVFRNGFWKSLLLSGIDTSKVGVNNYLTRLSYLKTDGEIKIKTEEHNLFIFPATQIIDAQQELFEIRNAESGHAVRLSKRNCRVYYWNKKMLIQLF